MNNNEISTSLSSETRLIELVTEAKKELEELQPEIEYLEDCITKLSTLREKETNSVVRVMTGWGVLSHCFWNQFNKTQSPKAGLPR